MNTFQRPSLVMVLNYIELCEYEGVLERTIRILQLRHSQTNNDTERCFIETDLESLDSLRLIVKEAIEKHENR